MKRPKLGLSLPLTDQDESFMAFLLAGIREKRRQATAGPEIVNKEKPSHE